MIHIVDGRFEQSDLKVVAVYDSYKAFDGYTLFNQIGKKEAFLVDMQGQIVHCWQMQNNIRIGAELLTNGNLLCGGLTPETKLQKIGGSAGELVEVDWTGKLVWRYEDPYLDAHDWCRLENGNTIISRFVSIPDDIAAKIKGGLPGSELDGVMWTNCLQEITHDQQVMWEWVAYEHIDFEEDVICPLCPRETWTYINSIEVMPDEDILISYRDIDNIAIIDKKTGDFKWKWGRGELAHQHNAVLLDNGNILLFDNGLHRRDPVCVNYSRVIEVNPETNKIEWEYMDDNATSFYSFICSGVQRLPNGNTLISEASKGRIFEITASKEIVWEYISPFYGYYARHNIGWTNMMYRAYRYGHDYPGLRGKELDPGRFQWILHEKGKGEVLKEEKGTKDIEMEKRVRRRLSMLGY